MRDTWTPRPVRVPASRVARLGRLGSMATGIAGGMALEGVRHLSRGARPSYRGLLLTPGNMTRLANELAQMRGAAMKVGQLLSMDAGELLPPELSEILSRLRADAHFMPPRQLKSVLNANWGTAWLGQFERFDTRPVAAASIGQVHRVRRRSGEDLAVKVQYPGVVDSIDSDVRNVGALLRMSGLLPAGLDLAPYLEEARRLLRAEADYQAEAGHLETFGGLLADDPAFVVPRLYPEWTTPRILAMSFMPGRPIEETADTPQETRDRIATALIRLTLREVFEFGMMQSDPNFANYRYDDRTGRIVLLDFGATRVLDPDLVDLYRRLAQAGRDGDRGAVVACLAAIGFLDDGVLPDLADRVVAMAGRIFDAVLGAGHFDFAETALSTELNAEGMALAEAGYFPTALPMDALYLQRKFGGMFLLARRLGARVPLRRIVDEVLG